MHYHTFPKLAFFSWYILFLFIQFYQTGCTSEAVNKETFCTEMATAICDRLFDSSCLEDKFDISEIRYEKKSECISKEKENCQLLKNNSKLKYDNAKANGCIDAITQKECLFAGQGDFPSCREVFKELDPPSKALY